MLYYFQGRETPTSFFCFNNFCIYRLLLAISGFLSSIAMAGSEAISVAALESSTLISEFVIENEDSIDISSGELPECPECASAAQTAAAAAALNDYCRECEHQERVCRYPGQRSHSIEQGDIYLLGRLDALSQTQPEPSNIIERICSDNPGMHASFPLSGDADSKEIIYCPDTEQLFFKKDSLDYMLDLSDLPVQGGFQAIDVHNGGDSTYLGIMKGGAAFVYRWASEKPDSDSFELLTSFPVDADTQYFNLLLNTNKLPAVMDDQPYCLKRV